MYMRICGKTLKEIAQTTGLGESTVATIASSPLFKEETEKLAIEVQGKFVDKLADPKQYLNQKAILAAKKLVYLMENSESEGVQLTSANSILDRAGAPKINKVDSEVVPNVYIDNRVMRLLLVSKLEAGLVPEEQKGEVVATIKELETEGEDSLVLEDVSEEGGK
jgi:hypothetical protein